MTQNRVNDISKIIELLDPANPDKPKGSALRIARFLARIVQDATAGWDEGEAVPSMIRCHRKLGPTPCEGWLGIALEEAADEVHWGCSDCGEQGVLLGWRGSFLDLSQVAPPTEGEQGGVDPFVVTDPAFEALLAAESGLDAAAQRVCHTARGGPGDGEVTLAAPGAWVEHFGQAVAAVAQKTTDPSKRTLLEEIAARART